MLAQVGAKLQKRAVRRSASAAKPEWEALLVKLDKMGFNKPRKNMRLLDRFDGDFDKVRTLFEIRC